MIKWMPVMGLFFNVFFFFLGGGKVGVVFLGDLSGCDLSGSFFV